MTNWHFLERLRSLVKDQDLVVAFEMNTEGKILCTVIFDAPGDGSVIGGGRDLPEALEDAERQLTAFRVETNAAGKEERAHGA